MKAAISSRSRPLLLLVLALGLIPGCGPRPPEAQLLAFERAERICRERQAELPPATTAFQARQAFLRCMEDNPTRQNRPQLAARPDPAAAAVPRASPEMRYLHCRLHSDEIAAAYTAHSLSSARWAYADSTYPNDDPRYTAARLAHQRAVAEVERLIPPAMRDDQPLIPDALDQFRRCQRESFR